jgi:hypothetical protein
VTSDTLADRTPGKAASRVTRLRNRARSASGSGFPRELSALTSKTEELSKPLSIDRTL